MFYCACRHWCNPTKPGVIVLRIRSVSQEVNTSIVPNAEVFNTPKLLNRKCNTSTSEVKTIRHGYLPSNGDALIFVAKEEGFWTEEGLNVELYQFTKGTEGYNSLFGNKLDTVGAGTSDPATYIAQGQILQLSAA